MILQKLSIMQVQTNTAAEEEEIGAGWLKGFSLIRLRGKFSESSQFP
jgi:hypothetical protein